MALENLLSNAIKYSYPNSSIQVVVRNTAKSAIIEVHDEGVGIDEQQADEVFDKFVRLDNPLSVQEGGTGLGLFLVKQIALAHGGSVTVQPSPRQGTVFTLKIPLKKPQRRRS